MFFCKTVYGLTDAILVANKLSYHMSVMSHLPRTCTIDTRWPQTQKNTYDVHCTHNLIATLFLQVAKMLCHHCCPSIVTDGQY